ncbi:GNAT family N-acetyltransferase [Desertimonas flava]|uniref:GNAT family N-acetyltransferase n=1 Tax=Desertimonas flava TaxID=2064846 RepID=UPI0019695C67|nr:GNAT family N-acetyltransferase [Desertimonas flava]
MRPLSAVARDGVATKLSVVLPASDRVVLLRPFEVADRRVIIQGRDEESDRWLGPGSPEPSPTACIEVGGLVVGWIDADPSPAWLQPGEANIGYSVFPAHRGNGYATRALRLLAAELDVPGVNRALLVIDVDNHASIRVARAAGARVLTSRRLSPFPTSIVYSLALTPRAGPD